MADLATSVELVPPAPRVLVVDDPEPISSNMPEFAEALRGEGYSVEVVAGARECLQRFADPPDVVLLGTMRPGMPWTELCRHIQATADVPVIVAARIESEIDAVLAFEFGVAGYLSDPSRTREMLARVRAALRDAPSQEASSAHRSNASTAQLSAQHVVPSPTLVAGGVEIDLVGRSVTVEGAPVYLARREFDLLSALLSPPGVVRTRRELSDIVWQGRDMNGSRTLDTHIRRLRLKLETDPTCPRVLTTVRGVGFMFRLDTTGEDVLKHR